ncbi:MAG: flagellar basal-body MS-ring/collar protein FliF [Chloroflexi bacterium]|nr:flagellar basal-body MS-ring/collar protein FliF [Chloroflexota bacterium]
MFASILLQFTTYWKKLSLGRQITMTALILAVLILTPVLVSWVNTPSYSVAYTGLSEADAAQIVQKLDDNNIPYQLKNSGSIEVPSDQVYTTRLLMAREGLPQSSTVGYELFSGTSMLGMTEFSQKVNYQRAIEGELERTIGSLDSVQTVRVHLVTPEKSLLSSDQLLSTASVTIQIKPGRTLDSSQVRAVTHLVASSVEGLKSENVVVVDSEGNMLADGMGTASESDQSLKDDQRAAELAYAAEVQKNVQNILDTILGPNRSVVKATVEMDWTQREITSNTFAPTEVAIRSSQIINESSSDGGATGGVAGAVSNLPTPVATTTANGNSTYQRSEETLNYEVSQTQLHEVIAPGKVNRVSVSVMVDNITDATQMTSIKSAVEVAAGIDSTRGDKIVVESFAFDRTAMDALSADLAKQQQQELYMQIGMAVATAMAVLALLFVILRMINNVRNASKESWKTVLRPVSEMAALENRGGRPALQQPVSGLSLPAQSLNRQIATAIKENEDVVVHVSPKARKANATEDEQNAKVISRLAEENPATVAEIIQIWLNESKKVS